MRQTTPSNGYPICADWDPLTDPQLTYLGNCILYDVTTDRDWHPDTWVNNRFIRCRTHPRRKPKFYTSRTSRNNIAWRQWHLYYFYDRETHQWLPKIRNVRSLWLENQRQTR